MRTFLMLLPIGLLVGCAEDRTEDLSTTTNDDRENVRVQASAEPDNTGVNRRDRNDAAKTPFDQNENQADIDVTANIRSRVVDRKLSINAHNVKIITQNGKVTLRGPVSTTEEKSVVEGIAADVAGANNVTSELELTSNR